MITKPARWAWVRLLPLVLFPLTLVTFLYAALPVYSTTHRLLASAVFILGTLPLLRFAQRPVGVPLLELVALQYAILFALPVFHEERLAIAVVTDTSGDMAITITLTAALLALAATGLGFRLSGSVVRTALRPIQLDIPDRRFLGVGLLSVVGALLVETSGMIIPAGWSRPLMLILSLDLGVAILACLYHRRRLRYMERMAAAAALLAAVTIGFAGGMAQAALQPLLIWILCGWMIRRRPPVGGFALLLAGAIVLQPVKSSYRTAVWFGERSYSVGERIALYGNLVYEHWSGRVNDSDALAAETRNAATQRFSLLRSTARYVDWTPSVIDYKGGRTLLYLVYGWVPRFIWADKPIAQEANVQLPVEYGLQSLLSVKRARFGVGHVAEVYVNFGLAGIVPVFLLLGAFFRVPPVLLGQRPTIATTAIFVALAVNMMLIGSTVGNVFGGFLQQIIVQVGLLKLFARRRATPMNDARLGAREPMSLTPTFPVR